jgi:hypothetical protein
MAMTWRRLTRLEGMLLGALVELTEKAPTPAPTPAERPLCCRGYEWPQVECSHCGPLLRGKALVDKVLKMQRTPPKKRSARKPAPRGGGRGGPVVGTLDERFVTGEGSGRGGKRVGERRQAARTFHIIDADSSSRDVELARHDLVEFFGDVLEKHHPGGY